MSRAHIGKIRCQKCRAANPLGQELCVECGTRLMLISSTAGIRFQAESGQSVHDEHLLERVSAVETHLLRLASRLEQVLELMLRQSRSAYFDHTLVETLIEVLSETKQIDGAKFDRRWRERCERDDNKQGREHKLQRVRASVEKNHAQTHTAEVTQLVLSGFDLIENGKIKEGIKKLELAAAAPPYVASLQRFLSEHFLRAGKMRLTHDYAVRGLGADPHDQGLMLLAGLTHADASQTDEAQKLLQSFIELGGKCFAAYYSLGRLKLHAGDLKSALILFKQALKAKPCAEAFYVVGSLYFSRGQFRLAINYLKKSLDHDQEYIDAARTLAHAYAKTGETKLARQMFAIARDDCALDDYPDDMTGTESATKQGFDENARRSKTASRTTKKSMTATGKGKKVNRSDSTSAEENHSKAHVPSFVRMAQAGLRGNVLSGGNARLASLVVADALEAVVER